MTITVTLPWWLLWIGGGALALGVLLLACVGAYALWIKPWTWFRRW